MKSSVSRHIGKYENEASLRLHRGAVEASKKLEQQLTLSSSLSELFSSQITDLRMRLKDYYERLIFTDPVEYGKKGEDLLWRKVYYDFFFRCKQNRKKLAESDYYRNSLISHLLAGIGFYHHMLLRIQTEFHIELEGKVDVPFLWHLKGVKKERWKKYQQSAATENSVKSWASQACHRILIYLGDLERYISEFSSFENTYLSERYYQQAFCLNSKNGIPHNQLGSLYNSRFESAYHYMRCLSCSEKCDLAEVNLKREFEKNEEILEQLYSSSCQDKESLKCIKFLSRFLKLCQIFYFSPGENSEIYCQGILQEFDITSSNHSYDHLPVKEEASTLLTDDMIFKMVVMSLMCVSKLQEKGHSDVSVATAFCLALFSYVLDRATKRLIISIYELRSEADPKDSAKENNLKEDTCMLKERLNNSVENVNKEFASKKPNFRKIGRRKLSKRRLGVFRRRRKMSSTSQEDSELSEGEINDLPESDEENILINSDVSETGSLSSESLSENEDELLIEHSDINAEKLKKEINVDKTCIDINEPIKMLNGVDKIELKKVENDTFIQIDKLFDNPTISPENLIDVLQKNGLLMCLKILSDWLRINEDILSACAESSQILLSRVIELLNLLLKIEVKLLTSKEPFLNFKCTKESWKQIYPLPEDTCLQGFAAIHEVHSHMLFEVSKRRELSSSSQIFLRIQCLLSFGKCLIKASESSIDFDTEKKKYYFNLCSKMKESNKDSICNLADNNSDVESQKQNLMRSMAHLWLKAEVNDLETLVEGGSGPQLSPYLVSDTSVLCYNLATLKQLIASKRFIVIVPLIVIANLDYLKKESIGAREAIRWLETELRKGCRFIRAQRQMEKISLVPMKYPRKKEKDAWDFFQVLECCNYLVQQQTTGKMECSLVTLLVGPRNHLPENAVAIAQSIDISIENLGMFYSKWRNSLKNPG